MSSRPSGYRFRGLFWPGLLILIGVLALLVNTNLISPERLYRLADLWPLILIVIGLLLLVGRTPMPATTATVAGALILLLAAVGAIAYVAAGPTIPGGTRTLDRSEAAQGMSHASLEIDVGGATINATGNARLDPDLFRVHIEYSGQEPTVSLDRSSGRVLISQNRTFNLLGTRPFRVDLQINAGVKWDVAIHTGGSNATLNFASAKIGSIELDTGASTDDITLGQPSGTVPISINGGALTVHLHRPSGTSAFVHVAGGSVSLVFDGKATHAVGSLEAGSSDQPDYYRVEINGGACNVTMDTASA